MKKTRIDLPRDQLKELRKERKRVQLEKGLAAEHNKDIRENSEYDYWYEREVALTTRIRRLSVDIEKEYRKIKQKP